ncbi:MAG: thermonuclease family protein [Bacilli bacterium]
MKKYILFILLLFVGIQVSALEKFEVTLSKCVDGDTANFMYKGKLMKARFLAIDTPELQKDTYGNEASSFTCKYLSDAKKIELEYDAESDKYDKYKRHLVWVFVDNKLLQEKIVIEGFAKVAYIYGNYKYTNDLLEAESIAKNNKLNIWKEETNISLYITVVLIIILILILLKKKRY